MSRLPHGRWSTLLVRLFQGARQLAIFATQIARLLVATDSLLVFLVVLLTPAALTVHHMRDCLSTRVFTSDRIFADVVLLIRNGISARANAH